MEARPRVPRRALLTAALMGAPGAQYLAARELKRQSWRFHKQHCAWFQARA